MNKLCFGFCLILLSQLVFCKTEDFFLHQQKLKKIEQDIKLLNQRVEQSKNKRKLLVDELGRIEKQIGENSVKFNQVNEKQTIKQQQFLNIEQHLAKLQAELEQQQQQLSKHIQLRAQESEYEPLKWFLYPNQLSHLQRFLQYHLQIIDSRKKLIDNIRHTQQNISHRLEQRQHTAEFLVKNQQQLKQVQEKLVRQKTYQAQLIMAIDKEIAMREQRIRIYEANKKRLTKLLESFNQQPFTPSGLPFAKMKGKLPPPVISPKISVNAENKGINLDAVEGSVVRAVYSGKVVFSDWLRGYGLLIIVDHGQGYMTLYAHNQSLYHKKGDFVGQNQQIATVGHSGGNPKNSLYFEIRHKGKALSPVGWLSLKNS